MRRGYVRPEDELPLEPDPEMDGIEGGDDSEPESSMPVRAEPETIAAGADPAAEPEEDEGLKPLPERLVAELTVHRTLALRQALGERPDVALLAALHALCLKLFYPYGLDTCLELELRQVAFGAQVRGLGETAAAKALEARHQAWAALLPRGPADLWAALSAMDEDTRRRLFAHCVGGAVNAVQETWNRRPRALAHAGQLAAALRLDMAGAWTPTVDSYLGRVTKARILEAVREAKGEAAAERLANLKKGEMAAQAEALLARVRLAARAAAHPGRSRCRSR